MMKAHSAFYLDHMFHFQLKNWRLMMDLYFLRMKFILWF